MSFIKIALASFILINQFGPESSDPEFSEEVPANETTPTEVDGIEIEVESVDEQAEPTVEEPETFESNTEESPSFEDDQGAIETPATPAAPPVTNSGEPFRDPFSGDAEPSFQESQPDFGAPSFEDQSNESNSELPPEEPGFQPEPVAPPPPRVISPGPSFQAPAAGETPTLRPGSGFEFPDEDKAKGPISQDVQRRRAASRQADVGTWHASFRPGAGFNFNRRPTQVSFELEGGYRMWEKIDLNMITHLRFISDRILGFIFLPTYTFTLSGKDALNRIDLRLGLGTGWIFRGESGAGFQYGIFPIRTDVELSYNFQPTLAFLFQLGTETYLAESETGGATTNQLSNSKGPPTQLLTHVGFRMEF